MKPLELLEAATQPRSLIMGASTTIMGVAASLIYQPVRFLPFILCMLFTWLVQLAYNTDMTAGELKNLHGPLLSELYNNGEKESENIGILNTLEKFVTSQLILALTIGIVIVSQSGIWTVFTGAALLVLVYMSLRGTSPLSRTPMAPIITFMVFGPLGVLANFVVQSGDQALTFFEWKDIAVATLMGCGIGFLAVNCQITRNYQTYRRDIILRRGTTVTYLGHRTSRYIYLFNGVLMLVIYSIIATPGMTTINRSIIDTIPCILCFCINTYVGFTLRHYSHNSGNGNKKELLSWNPYTISLLNMLLLSVSAAIIYGFSGTHLDNMGVYYMD